MEKEFQRWTAKRKVELLLQLIRGHTKLVDACREPASAGQRRAARTIRPSTSAKCASCGQRWANWSWSSTPEKTGCPDRETRESLLTVQRLVRAEGKAVSIAQLCRWFGVPRSTFYYRPTIPAPRVPVLDAALVATIRPIIEAEPAAGLRMITARVRRASPVPINRKKVHRILKVNGWQVRQRPRGQRPRVQGWESRATRPNERWAIDTPLRSDNGLVFGAKIFVSVVRRYGLDQEYITPYSAEQNGMIERFFLTLKRECVWLQRFGDRNHAFRVIADWLDRYHSERPHSALGYLTPKEFSERIAA